jgi:hypothetical protein
LELVTTRKKFRRSTTMNVYGRAMTDSKRQAHKNVVEMVLKLQPEKIGLDREEEVVAVKVV